MLRLSGLIIYNTMRFSTRSFIFGLALGFVVIMSALGGALADRIFVFTPLNYITDRISFLDKLTPSSFRQEILTEESVVIDVVEEVSDSVVTVSMELPERRVLEFSPFGGFETRIEGGDPQDIGSGFVVSKDGLIITNKHVVSQEGASYKVITSDNQEYEVREIKRDPANDLAVLRIDAHNLKPVKLGTSDELKVGQFVIAIGTALGEFRSTVTTGVISGLGRGITAGSSFEGFVERLDDVIQTDAAINPGNSGGPLLNSAGQVIGVNVAVAQGAENIGFAIPIEIVRKALAQFEQTGNFASKPYLGVSYNMLSREAALLNEVPQGAYIAEVIEGSGADRAGIRAGDIITKFGEDIVSELEDGLGEAIEKYNPGDAVKVTLWRDGETMELTVTLSVS